MLPTLSKSLPWKWALKGALVMGAVECAAFVGFLFIEAKHTSSLVLGIGIGAFGVTALFLCLKYVFRELSARFNLLPVLGASALFLPLFWVSLEAVLKCVWGDHKVPLWPFLSLVFVMTWVTSEVLRRLLGCARYRRLFRRWEKSRKRSIIRVHPLASLGVALYEVQFGFIELYIDSRVKNPLLGGALWYLDGMFSAFLSFMILNQLNTHFLRITDWVRLSGPDSKLSQPSRRTK